jgi:uncharacterized protein (DUF2252 family)
MTKQVVWLIGGGVVLLLLSWFLPGIVGNAATSDEESERALRQASVELLHPELAEGVTGGEQADMGVAQQLIAQQQVAAAAANSRGKWTRVVLVGLGVFCLGAAVLVYYASQAN